MTATSQQTDGQTGTVVEIGFALVTAVAMAGAAYALFEVPALSVFVGAMGGAGSYFIFPWMTRMNSDGEAAEAGSTGGFHQGAAGFALDGAAIVTFAAMFVLEAPYLAMAIGLAVAAAEYAVLAVVLPRPGE